MVRGVNKTIIEINDTGNRYFERVLLFVSSEHWDEQPKKLERHAVDYVKSALADVNDGGSGRHIKLVKKDERRAKSIAFLVVAGFCVAVAALVLLLLL